MLDTAEYLAEKYVSMIAEFTGTELGNGLENVYFVFEIRDIHLW